MTNENPTMSIGAFSRSDQAELLEFLSPAAIHFEEERLLPGQLGEPVMAMAFIALTMTAITGLCAWIASKDKNVTVKAALDFLGVTGKFEIAIDRGSTPETIRRDIEAKGGQVAEG